MEELPVFGRFIEMVKDEVPPATIGQVVALIAAARVPLADVADQIAKHGLSAPAAALCVAAAHEILVYEEAKRRAATAKSESARARDAERHQLRREECDPETWAVISAAVLRRDGLVCRYCGDERGPFEADHIHPVIRGGRSFLSNLACACRACNSAKGARTPREWGVRLMMPEEASRAKFTAAPGERAP